MRKFKFLACTGLLICCSVLIRAQETFPENGVADPRHGYYVFINATIVKDAATTLNNASLIIKDGRIVAVGANLKSPAGAVEIDCKGKYIYPSFIDIYADYATTVLQRPATGPNFFGAAQLESNTKGAYGWNQAIKSEVDAFKVFVEDENKAKPLRESGFGVVLSHVRDGIARGTGALVSLSSEKENFVILKQRASAHYAFNKGSSTQSYPNSMMGMIALLRERGLINLGITPDLAMLPPFG